MRYNLIFNILGMISKYIGIMFIIPIIACFLLKENCAHIYFITGIIALLIGFLFSFNKAPQKEIDNIKKSESLTIVFFAWVLFALISSIPYLFYDFSITNAIFEATSGVTTTGATVITDFSQYPKSLFFFRSLTQWFGGMGIIVLFIAVLPKISVAGRQMFYAEIPAPTEDKATPRIRFTASWLWGLYLTFTVIEAIILRLFCQLDTYHAIVTSISTIATGGFSPLFESIMGFNNLPATICVLFFMYIAGINYILIYRGIRNKKISQFFKSEEFKAYTGIIVFLSLFLAASLYFNSHYELKSALLNSFFEIVSTMTSTGFASDNYIKWDAASKVILFLAFFTGGCATSTSGGMKIVRWVFVVKYLKKELNKIIHPQGVYPIKLEGGIINNDTASQMMMFVIFYLVIFALGAFLIILIENNTTIALSASASAIGNIGPGFGSIGPMGDFNSLHSLTKWIITLLMLIGRLEIIPFLAILNKDLWKN